MAAKVLRVKQRFAVSVFFAFVSLRPIDHRRFHPVHALSFRPSLYILVESRNREFQSGCRTAPVKQIVLEVLPLFAITFPSPHPSLIFSLRIFIYTVLTARLIRPFFFFLISHLCHTFPILWPTFLFSFPHFYPYYLHYFTFAPHSLLLFTVGHSSISTLSSVYSLSFISLTFFVALMFSFFVLRSGTLFV